MRITFLIVLVTLFFEQGRAQNYVKTGDSCFRQKDYVCAAMNFETFLEKQGPESNVIAYRAAVAWALTGDTAKTFLALQRYVRNNALNNWTFFSAELEKEKSFDFIKADARWVAMLGSVKQSEEKQRKAEKAMFDSAIAVSDLFFKSLDARRQIDSVIMAKYSVAELPALLQYRSPAPFLTKNGMVLFITVNKSQVPFYIQLPENYDPAIPSPALVVLHGAVRVNKGYGTPDHLSLVYRMTSKHIPFYAKN
jgi:hypothetical protein